MTGLLILAASFNLIDFTVNKNFINNKLNITTGIRNLLDVSSVNSSSQAAGAHSPAATNILMGYGRSYFLRISYQLNK